MELFCGWSHEEHPEEKVDPSQWYLQEHWRHVPRFLFRLEQRLDDLCPRLPFHVLNHQLIPWRWSVRPHHQVPKLLQERLLIFVGHFYRLQAHYWSQEVYLQRKRQRLRRDLRPEKFCLNSCHSPILSNFYCSKVLFRASVFVYKIVSDNYSRALAPATISVISCVIAAWRARLYWIVNSSMTFLALSVAVCMAIIPAAFSAVLASIMAP